MFLHPANESIRVLRCKLDPRSQGVVLPQDRRITVLCVDDHPIVREGIVSIIEGDSDLRLVAEAETAQQAITAFHTWQPDVTVIDLRLPDRDGVDVIKQIRKDFPKSRFVVLTSAEGDIDIRRALEAGAQAYLIKGVVRTELRQVIKAVYLGERHVPANVAEKIAAHLNEPILTARELEVLQLVAAGLRNKEVAARLSISEETVKMHLRNLMQKLEVNDRTHAVMVAVRRGFIRP
jgi:DNA-binding NarL/FixJ family response regulator